MAIAGLLLLAVAGLLLAIAGLLLAIAGLLLAVAGLRLTVSRLGLTISRLLLPVTGLGLPVARLLLPVARLLLTVARLLSVASAALRLLWVTPVWLAHVLVPLIMMTPSATGVDERSTRQVPRCTNPNGQPEATDELIPPHQTAAQCRCARDANQRST